MIAEGADNHGHTAGCQRIEDNAFHLGAIQALDRYQHQRLVYRDAIRDSRIATTFTNTTLPCGRARQEWLFRFRFGQGRVAQPAPAPTLAVFASRSVISAPPRSARNYSARARLAVFVETHRLRTSDAEREQGLSRKPCLYDIRESRIASSPRDKMISLPQVIQAFGLLTMFRPAPELVVLVSAEANVPKAA